MNKDQLIAKAYELGFAYERDYHGCAQATIAAVQDALGIRNDFVFKAASGLSGGCGVLGDGMCGGYNGAAMVLSFFYGRRRSRFDDDDENKKSANRMIKTLHDRFIKEYGSVICRGVQTKIFGRSFNLRDKEEVRVFEEAGAHTDKCTAVVGNASAWAMEILLDEIAGRKMSVADLKHLIYVEPNDLG